MPVVFIQEFPIGDRSTENYEHLKEQLGSDPDAEWIVDPSTFFSKGKNTPLAGVTLRGRVTTTIVGGRVVYGDVESRA